MMQTLLTQTPSAAANGLDKAPLSGSVESKSIDGGTGSDSKGDFATLIAKARNSEQGAAEATQGGNHVRSAKSLATESASPKEEIGKEQDPDADNKVEEVPATDFLLRLQDSLKLDTSLVTPQLAVAAQQSATAVDGNPLPQEGELEGIALDESEQTPAAVRIASQLAGQTGAQSPLATTANSTLDTTVSSSAARVVAKGDASAAVLSSEGEDAATTADGQAGEKASAKGETLGADGKHTKPLTGAERMAQLAKVLPVDESASTAKSAESLATKEAGDSKSALTASNVLTNKGQATQAATQGTALKAFSEGLKQPEAGAATTSATADGSGVAGKGAEKGAAEGSQQQATAANQSSAPVRTAQSAAESAAAQSSVTTNATAQTDNAVAPVMVAPQQVLAQAESQGPQAPLSTISAGIKQMEVTGTDEVRKAVSLEVKPKAGEAEKSLVATTSSGESSPSQTVQHGQNSQTQDSRAPAAETTLRREPQNLPHLKLASQEAPVELHQKVNVMLAEKLQQAEIQLDPLGLGKMKIQIQMGADSQANVHFVVQHGQTREMLEQAMPRLRDMLAGQGIQLGQTQVQQQSQQQQQQGQPTFNGQGQQGQSSGQPRSGNGLVEGELTTSNPSLLVESTNGSGIDFYA
ncbi:flagellar hook-length control protein FliK [Aeromonas veronii]